ncbi:MAG: hypothetical protein V4467_00930 [Patescibacteria group bacterium]
MKKFIRPEGLIPRKQELPKLLIMCENAITGLGQFLSFVSGAQRSSKKEGVRFPKAQSLLEAVCIVTHGVPSLIVKTVIF